MQRRFVEQILRGEVDECKMWPDQVVEAYFQNGVGDDLISGVGGTILSTEIELFAAEQNLVGIGVQVLVEYLLSADQKVSHVFTKSTPLLYDARQSYWGRARLF